MVVGVGVNMLLVLAFLGALTAFNMATAWWMSRLKDNPWKGTPFGGRFSMIRPGSVPGRLTVSEINRRGRIGMYAAPIVFALMSILVIASRNH